MARKQHNIHYIYKTTCNVTGRWYIGMHSTSNLDDGYMGSGLVLRRSIRKYGTENHTKEILEFCDSREDLTLREIDIVTKELIIDDLCMNLCVGGQGGFISLEGTKKGRLKTNQILIEKYGENYQSIITKNYHKNLTLDGKKKFGEKVKLGQIKNNYVYGSSFKNKTHSDETKQLMSDKAKLRTSEKNSQYGTCWITKDGLNKKIKKEALETYLNEGWIKGRK